LPSKVAPDIETCPGIGITAIEVGVKTPAVAIGRVGAKEQDTHRDD
jgi:hypothetical protein